MTVGGRNGLAKGVCFTGAGKKSFHTSMPMTGMRVMISASRQKEKRRPPSILAMEFVSSYVPMRIGGCR